MALSEISDITCFSAAVFRWVDMFLKRRDIHQNNINQAIKSLMDSLNDTASYMKSILENPDFKSNEIERKLSESWRNTSILIRQYNTDLAERCFFKGIYWTNTSRFTEQELIDNKMKLYHVELEVAKILKTI